LKSIITIKLTNTNKNTNFLLENYSEFYRKKYSIDIYRGNYSEKKKIKTKLKKYDGVSFHTDGINIIGKIRL
jgi:hypothetical protein